MSTQHFMDNLLDGAEVEWKPLGEVLQCAKGTKITAGRMKELHKDGAPLKIFAGGRTVAFVDFKDIPAKDVNREPSIIVKSRGVIEFEYYAKPFSHKNEMWSYHSANNDLDIKYVYHFLKLNGPHFQNLGSKMQMPQIATPDTGKFQIPIPCPNNPEKSLKIQAEIVRILDTFTKLTTELTTRKKQYNYYPRSAVELSCPRRLVCRTGRGFGRQAQTGGRLMNSCEEVDKVDVMDDMDSVDRHQDSPPGQQSPLCPPRSARGCGACLI